MILIGVFFRIKLPEKKMNRHVTSRIALLAAGACMVWWTCDSPARTTQEHVHKFRLTR